MRKFFILFFVISAVLITFIFSKVQKILNFLPDDMVSIHYSNPPPPPVPTRPGIGDIIISGPKIEPLIFSVDPSYGIPLDWSLLREKHPSADVIVYGYINSNGFLLINKIDAIGQPKAGKIIFQAIKTWKYKAFKIGEIKFYFNLPSEGRKFIIDTQNLNRNPAIADFIEIYDGRLYNIINK